MKLTGAALDLTREKFTVVGKHSKAIGAGIQAATAAAHKLARIFYRLWTSGDQFIDPGVDAYEQRYRERVVNNLKKKAFAFGLELTPISNSTQCVS
ncbi:MAG TPA: hypothetical protein V6D25_02710 [Leptolyngbyaceae cyanobacterium]